MRRSDGVGCGVDANFYEWQDAGADACVLHTRIRNAAF